MAFCDRTENDDVALLHYLSSSSQVIPDARGPAHSSLHLLPNMFWTYRILIHLGVRTQWLFLLRKRRLRALSTRVIVILREITWRQKKNLANVTPPVHISLLSACFERFNSNYRWSNKRHTLAITVTWKHNIFSLVNHALRVVCCSHKVEFERRVWFSAHITVPYP